MRKLAAAAAIVGGLIWVSSVVITALRPIGHSGVARSTLDLDPVILVAFVLMAWSATALASDLQPSRVAWTGAAVSWIAVALLGVNVAVVLATGDDAPVWPTHYAAFFFMALGMSLLGVAALRVRALPLAAGIAMIVAPLPMPLGNMQNDSVLLWLPLGVGSLAAGIAMGFARRAARRSAA